MAKRRAAATAPAPVAALALPLAALALASLTVLALLAALRTPSGEPAPEAGQPLPTTVALPPDTAALAQARRAADAFIGPYLRYLAGRRGPRRLPGCARLLCRALRRARPARRRTVGQVIGTRATTPARGQALVTYTVAAPDGLTYPLPVTLERDARGRWQITATSDDR